jgi:N-acetylglutamate synthase-like GNAT family acetyltransferase
MAAPQIEKVLGPPKRELFKALRDFNIAAVGKPNYRQFAVTIRDKRKIAGGLVAEMYWGWMFVNALWISEPHRRNGWGKSLLQKAEAEARKSGVRNVFLDSFSFQAPKFYAKLGYREFGRLKHFPAGHDRIWMTKAL